MGTLSQWLRSIVTEDSSEPQPERVSSHATVAPPSPVDNPVESVENVVDVETEVMTSALIDTASEVGSAPAGDHTEPASMTSVEDIPPEFVGLPATDAEREELAKAKEEAWPTTRGDD